MQMPKVKPEHTPYRFADGTIRIGGELYGTSAEIADPRGCAWDALTLMDGTRTLRRIERELALRHRDLDPVEVRRLIAVLVDSGYVEDISVPVPAGISDSDSERYSRNHAYFRRVDLRPGSDAWQSQLELKRARVLVLGLGGSGSHAAWALAAAGVGALHCVDPDVVEESNLTRQVLYTESDIGLPKAEVAAERLAALNSSISLTYEKRACTTASQLSELVRGHDVLALCADEPHGVITPLANRVCGALGLPWMSAGYNGPMVAVGVYGPGGPCFLCVAAGEEARLKPGARPDMHGVGVLAPLAGIAGHLIAYEIIALLTGTGRISPGYVRGMNALAPDQHVFVRHPSRPECPVCGTRAPGRTPREKHVRE